MKNKSVCEIRNDLMDIFVDHIGQDNALTYDELFRYVWGVRLHKRPRRLTLEKKATVEYLFELQLRVKLSQALTLTRKTTDCFPIRKIVEGKWLYFVPTTMREAAEYILRTQRCVEGYERLGKRCKSFIRRKRWSKNWEIEGKI